MEIRYQVDNGSLPTRVKYGMLHLDMLINIKIMIIHFEMNS